MKNKIVVITGSTRGFGYSIAQAMLQAGATVIINGRSKDALDRALQSLANPGRVEGMVCDVREEQQVYALARQVVERHRQIDVWVNNAGYSASAGMILDIPHYHHERWDGTGYPHRLKEEQIPLPARLFAIVDVYDALTSHRPYRPAWKREEAVEYVGSQGGKHFDPKITTEFLALLNVEK